MRDAAARQIEPDPAMLSCNRFMNISRTRRSICFSSPLPPTGCDTPPAVRRARPWQARQLLVDRDQSLASHSEFGKRLPIWSRAVPERPLRHLLPSPPAVGYRSDNRESAFPNPWASATYADRAAVLRAAAAALSGRSSRAARADHARDRLHRRQSRHRRLVEFPLPGPDLHHRRAAHRHRGHRAGLHRRAGQAQASAITVGNTVTEGVGLGPMINQRQLGPWPPGCWPTR